jgi:DNA-binding NarL/FixJ family response regulator
MTPIALAIIEDQPAIRTALTEYLGMQPEFRCVLAADSVETFLAAVEELEELPRLVLSDIGLPGRSGIEGLPLIRQRLPEVEVVMLSVFADAERVFQALCAGAVGYLLKNTAPAIIKESLLQVAQGGSPMSPSIARHVIRHFQPRQHTEEALTPREQQIVQGIEDGLSYKLIAARLGISVDTVRNHIQQVYRKLRVNSKGEIMARAYKRAQGGA